MSPEYSDYLTSIKPKLAEHFGNDIVARSEFIVKIASYEDYKDLPAELKKQLDEIVKK